MKKSLSEVRFEEFGDKSFEIILTVEMLCEVCEKPLRVKDKFLRKIQILSKEDYRNLLDRSRVHDRVEIDVENCRIYLYDHDYPGDVHPECAEKLSLKYTR